MLSGQVLMQNRVQAGSIELNLRSRTLIGKTDLENKRPPYEKGTWVCCEKKLIIDPRRLVIVVVDMWDSHPCGTMLQEEEALIQLMNSTLAAARKLGIQVVFAPSRCGIAERWKDKPQRTRVEAIPCYPLPPSNHFSPEKWPDWQAKCMCPITEINPDTKEPIYQCHPASPSTDQHPGLIVMDEDLFINAGIPHERLQKLGVSGSIDTWGETAQQELYNICMERGAVHVLYMGCATNMCIVNREFGMVQARRMQLQPILVRDLTFAMTFNGYDPDAKKLDSCFTPKHGTELSIRDIERYIGPSITSEQLLTAAAITPSATPTRQIDEIRTVFSKEYVADYQPLGASNSYRQLCLDYNWSAGDIEDYFTEADPRAIAEFCQQINLDALVLLNVPHQGFTTYRSESGPIFPQLKRDFFNEVVRECHSRNIAAFGYITLGRNWYYAMQHPEQSWQRSETEKFIDLKTPYLDLVLEYIREVLRICPVDALRFDTLVDDLDSRNPWAIQLYQKFSDEAIPEKWDDTNWRRQLDFYRWSTSRVARLCYETAKKVKPQIEIWQNGFMQSDDFDRNNLDAGRYQDMAYIEYGDPFRQLFLSGTLGLKGCIVGKILDSPVRRLCMALGAHCYSYYSVNPKTALPDDREWFYNDLAPFYGMVKDIQPFIEHAKPVPYFGILYSEATRYRWYHYDRSRYINEILKPLTTAFLQRSLITEYISNLDLPRKNLSPFKLILLPETSGLSAKELRALKEYVTKGGRLLVSGEALCYDEKGYPQKDFSLAGELGVACDSIQDWSRTPIRSVPIHVDKEEWRNIPLPQTFEPSRWVKTIPAKGETILSMEMDGEKVPLLHLSPLGRGEIAYLATSDNIALMQAVIDGMMGKVPISVQPANEQVIMTFQEAEKRWILHLIGDAELEITIAKPYAAPQRIERIYPEHGWSASSEVDGSHLTIHAGRGAENRVIVLK